MPEIYTEGERRLRAAVRAFVSPGIWLAIASQLLVLLLLRWQLPADAAPPMAFVRMSVTATALLLFLYMQSGAFFALTLSPDTLGAMEVVRRGKTVLADFLWLAIKGSLLFVLSLNVAAYVAMLITGWELKALIEKFFPLFGTLTGILGFIFAYWMPIVFVNRDFRLLAGWRAALSVARRRWSQSGYLAFLVLTPTLLSEWLPQDSPVALILLLSLLGGFMGWIAYIYGVEVLRDDPKPTTTPPAV